MSAKLSTALKNAVASTGSLSSQLDSCFLQFFDGPIPANADAAIDGSSALLCKVAASTDGTTGCTWDAAVNGALPKKASETWDGLIAVSGTPTFCRITVGADDGTDEDTGTTKKRVQCTAGGTGNDIVFSDPAFVANGSNRKGLQVFELQFAD